MLIQSAKKNVAPNRSALDCALYRKQELLNEEQKFRLLAGRHHSNQSHEYGSRNQRGHSDSIQIHSNVNSALGVQRLLGLDTTSSRQHPLVIQAALNALQTCHDRAYLTMLMTKEHNKADAVAPGGSAGALSSAEIPSRIHAAMQAQIRQLEEYNRLKARSAASTVMQNHVAQLHKEINQQNRLPISSQRNSSPNCRYPPGVRRASAA